MRDEGLVGVESLQDTTTTTTTTTTTILQILYNMYLIEHCKADER